MDRSSERRACQARDRQKVRNIPDVNAGQKLGLDMDVIQQATNLSRQELASLVK